MKLLCSLVESVIRWSADVCNPVAGYNMRNCLFVKTTDGEADLSAEEQNEKKTSG